MLSSIRRLRIAGLMMGVVISSQMMLAQKSAPPPGGGGNNPTPPGTRNTPTTLNPSSPNPNVSGSNMNLYLSGTVLLDDGTPPQEPVTIERVCNGAARAQAYTDLKGRFSFQLGDTTGILQDATEDGTNYPNASQQMSTGYPAGTKTPQQQVGSPDSRLANCELRAVLPGYRSDTISLAGKRFMDDPNVGSIVLHRLANVEGTAVSVTSLQAPNGARRAYEKARQYLKKNNLADAADELLKAVKIYPKYAAAWYELGMIQARNDDMERARESFVNAVAADAKFLSPYFPLIELAAIGERWTEVDERSTVLLKLDPVDYPGVYGYHATANMNLHNLDIAEKSARTGEKLDTGHRYPKLQEVLAAILDRKGDYAGALEHLRSYLALSPDAHDAPRMKIEVARLERLTGDNQQANAGKRKDDAAGSEQPGPPERRP